MAISRSHKRCFYDLADPQLVGHAMAPKAQRRDENDEEYHPAKVRSSQLMRDVHIIQIPSLQMQRGSTDPDMARKAKLKAYIIGLNNQFAK